MTEPTMRILSLGAGVQSTTLALMACNGTLPGLDAAIFADTGWEPDAVYRQVDLLEAELSRAGIPLHRVAEGNIHEDLLNPGRRYSSIPWHLRFDDGKRGINMRQCTREYKLRPITRKIRELLGAAPPNFRTVRRGRVAEQWIGFSTDEVYRVSDRRENLYTTKRFPLIELGMSRKDCQRWLKAQGWGHTAKSACIGCPFTGNAAWRDMRDNRPEEWASAVEFDRMTRRGGVGRTKPFAGEMFLHASLMPLDQAPIEQVTAKEWADRQLDIFDVFDDLEEMENGPAQACSPYGCRSGDRV